MLLIPYYDHFSTTYRNEYNMGELFKKPNDKWIE